MGKVRAELKRQRDGSASPAPELPIEEGRDMVNVTAATKVIICGSFPPLKRDMDFFYPNPQNDMWRILGTIFYGKKDHFFRDVAHPARVGATKKAFDTERIQRFVHARQDVGFCDAPKRVRRTNCTSADEGLLVVEERDFASEVLPLAPKCEAIITTGTLALGIILGQRQRQLVPVLWTRKGSARSAKKVKLPAIGDNVEWAFASPGSSESCLGSEGSRSVLVYRAPSTSRAYPRPFEEKLAFYRAMIEKHVPIHEREK